MKSFIKILGVGLCALVAACTEVEPLGMEVPAIPKDLSAIKAFKATEHAVSMVWFGNWKADGNMNTYLNTLPDSLDIIVLEAGYEEPSALQKEDLSVVRMQKGTKVLVAVDLDRWTNELNEKLEMAEADAEADVMDAAKASGKEATPEEIEAAVKVALVKAREVMKTRLNEMPARLEKLCKEYGYDGLSLHSSAIKEPFPRESLYAVIDQLGTVFGKKAGKLMLVLEGDLFYFTSKFAYFDYLVATTANPQRLAEVQLLYDRLKSVSAFEAKQFMTYLSLDDNVWSKPFPDVISASPSLTPRYKELALWRPADGAAIGGMALKQVGKDYERKYAVVRNTVQYLNLK